VRRLHDGGKFPFGRGRSRTNGTNGAHPSGMRTRRLAIDELASAEHNEDADPVDLVAVQADDELINALAAGVSVSSSRAGHDIEDHVTSILAAWKAEVDAEPVPELVDVDSAVAAIMSGRPKAHRLRHLAPVAAAAAFVVLTVGGLSVGSYSAEPSDVLWPVTKVLYSEKAESVEAADRVEKRITRAKQAIAAGQPALADEELKAAAADLAVVRPQEGRSTLTEVQDFLVAKAQETRPGIPTDPGAPLAADQTRRVPPGAAIAGPGRTSGPVSPESPPVRSSTPPVSNSPTSPDSGTVAPELVPDPRLLPNPAPESDEGTQKSSDDETPTSTSEEKGSEDSPETSTSKEENGPTSDDADPPIVPGLGEILPEVGLGSSAAGSGSDDSSDSSAPTS
jgi:hypothetical protein